MNNPAPGPGKKLRIFLTEDHEVVREGIRALIDARPDMEVVGEAKDGREALRLVQALGPDVIVMDISMPGMNGLEATRKLKEDCPGVKILTLTRHADEGYLQLLLRAGANGYVLKQSAAAELIHAIRTVATGASYLDSAITGKIITGYVKPRRHFNDSEGASLSDRETEVLRLIALGYGNKEIAAHLDISVKTIEAHKAAAMKKLNLNGRVDIVRYAMLRDWLKED